MKQMSEALSEYLSKEKSLQSCDLYTIRLVDGSVYRFASNDKDVEVDGTLYHRQPFMGLCEVDSAGGIAVKLKVKSEMQGLAAYIPPRVFVGQASYTNQSGTVVSSSTDHTNMLIPLKPSLNVLLQV